MGLHAAQGIHEVLSGQEPTLAGEPSPKNSFLKVRSFAERAFLRIF